MSRQLDVNFSLFGGAEELPPSLATPTPPSSTPSDDSDSEVASADADASSISSSTVNLPAGLKGPTRRDWEDQTKHDFLWTLTEEPHRSRRRAILKAHPEITKLMGYEPLTKYVVLGVVSLQLLCAYLLRNTSPLSPLFIACAYAIGGTSNQNLFLAIHEITHGLAFRGVKANRLFAIAANFPIGIPYAMLFKPYHLEHHKNLGEEGMDTDLPTRFEMLCLRNVLGKAFFCTFQIFFYAIRPGLVRAQRFSIWHALNFSGQALFDLVLVYFFGWRALIYLVMSSFFAGSLHPCAAHFIAEHYLFEGWDQETWSYYGPLNILAYNVGYHVEHHDFPNIPWTRLPALHAAAKEFYEPLPRHESWIWVTYSFIFDDHSGLFARVKRPSREGRAQDRVPVPQVGAGDKEE